jgi:hypothetical protein
MPYSIPEHGDLLEKEAAPFIQGLFSQYERVWSLFIGNKGNATMADLPGYPDDEKRQKIAQFSYTTLESLFLIQRLLEGPLSNAQVADFRSYELFCNSFLAYFAHTGRIIDMVAKIAGLLEYDFTPFKQASYAIFQARNIILHGDKVPVQLGEDGRLCMPILQVGSASTNSWDDRRGLWTTAFEGKRTNVHEQCSLFFYEMLALVDQEYGRLYHYLINELRACNAVIQFEWGLQIINDGRDQLYASGSTF